MSMTLEDLRILVAVAEAPSMGAAARSLGRTQPAVAQHIRRLEAELDARLLSRGPRGTKLTWAGELFYRRAVLALRALQVAAQELKESRDRFQELALSASTTSTDHLLKESILELRRRWPSLRLRLEVGTTVSQRLEAVRQRRVDLAFVTLAASYRGLETRSVVDMPLRLLVHREHPFAARKRLPLSTLSRIRYIALHNSTAVEYLRARLAGDGVPLEIAYTVDTPATAVLHVELGLGETFVPAYQAVSLAASDHVRAVAVAGLPSTPLGWACLDFGLLPPMAQALIAEVDRRAPGWTRLRRLR
jgi:DNA-binding transcriptional LysR family regulator